MVDPNPGRGMPAALLRYWVGGKGAAKIRWGMPHDFNRCVRNLRKYFPKNPEGLCNNLHQRALGAPPGKGHAHAITASAATPPEALVAAQALLDMQPHMGQYMWAGPLAPIGRPTGEPRRIRVFEPGSLDHRVLPLPLDWRERTGEGHTGGITVGRILGVGYGPDHNGLEYAWGWGDYLDESIIPEAGKARYLAEMGVAGPSLDPGGQVIVHMNPETGVEHMAKYTFGGATLVSIPAFAALRQMVISAEQDWPDDDPDYAIELSPGDSDCGCKGTGPVSVGMGSTSPTFTVNPRGWRGLPLAARDSVFDNDDAVKRIAAWAGVSAEGADTDKLNRAFLYYDPQLPAGNTTSYRLPVGDIINGRLTLVYHAIYAAAALLSGAHGGLPNVPAEDQAEIRNVISDIYATMAAEFNDSSVRAPWDRAADPGIQLSMIDSWMNEQSVLFAALGSGQRQNYVLPAETLTVRAASRYEPTAKARTDSVSHAAMSTTRNGFNGSVTGTESERLDVGSTRRTLSTPSINAVDSDSRPTSASRSRSTTNSSYDKTTGAPSVEGTEKTVTSSSMSITAIRQGKFEGSSVASATSGLESSEMSQNSYAQQSFTLSDEGYPIAPPRAWFDNPKLTRKTKITVTDEGHVYGHLAAWGECHRDVTMRECVLAPKSHQNYAPFHLGTVLTAEGDTVDAGKIIMDTRHASISLGYTAAAIHYDNTGDEVAVIRCGEDEFGIWFSGAIVPEANRKKVAKLRRSPLSGDWRRHEGNLELTAALAVNAPAFPVYSMENGEDVDALVAAGTVWFDDEPEQVFALEETFVAPTGIVPLSEDELSVRAQRLADLDEDEAIYARRERLRRLAELEV